MANKKAAGGQSAGAGASSPGSGPTAADLFYKQPILNSPYEEPTRHWELDEDHQPTRNILDKRRPADFITPVPKPKKKRKASPGPAFV